MIFVHGCFWHGHDCPMCRLPTTRPSFWQTKIEKNRTRDLDAVRALEKSGWRVLVVWECALRGPARRIAGTVIAGCEEFLRSETALSRELEGAWNRVADREG